MDKNIEIEYSYLVYQPREDTDLFLTNIAEMVKLSPKSIIEIGSGTGIIILHLLRELPVIEQCIAIDLNYTAAKLTLKNAYTNGFDYLQVICGDGLRSLRSTQQSKLIIFNPPYLPKDELDSVLPFNDQIQFSGGVLGYEMLLRVMSLFSHGSFISMISSLSITPESLSKLLPEFKIRVIDSAKFEFEILWLLEFNRR